jgi:hypothetical protein
MFPLNSSRDSAARPGTQVVGPNPIDLTNEGEITPARSILSPQGKGGRSGVSVMQEIEPETSTDTKNEGVQHPTHRLAVLDLDCELVLLQSFDGDLHGGGAFCEAFEGFQTCYFIDGSLV